MKLFFSWCICQGEFDGTMIFIGKDIAPVYIGLSLQTSHTLADITNDTSILIWSVEHKAMLFTVPVTPLALLSRLTLRHRGCLHLSSKQVKALSNLLLLQLILIPISLIRRHYQVPNPACLLSARESRHEWSYAKINIRIRSSKDHHACIHLFSFDDEHNVD